MKTKQALSVLAVALVAAAPVVAQLKPGATNDSYVLELLRRTIEEQKKSPDKIVRTPDAAVPADPKASGKLLGATSPEIADLENQYIQGKISAKQFQKELERIQMEKDQRDKAAAAAASSNLKPVVNSAVSPKAAAAAGGTTTTSQPAFPTPPPQPNPNQKKLTDVEMRLDEMIKKRMDREKAARDAAAAAALTNNPGGAPPTKRQRLDALLRQVVEGKMTDAEYRAQREKIVAEPD